MTVNDESALVYGIEYPTRALCAVQAASECPSFLVGTHALHRHSVNQVHQLTVDTSATLISQVFGHPAGEIWQLCSCPADERLLATCHSVPPSSSEPPTSQSCPARCCSVWRSPNTDHTDKNDESVVTSGGRNDDDGTDDAAHHHHHHQGVGDGHNLDCLTKLHCQESVSGVSWCASGDIYKIMAAGEQNMFVWDLSMAGQKATLSCEVAVTGRRRGVGVSGGRWNPHLAGRQLLSLAGDTVTAHDLRSNQRCWVIEHIHSPLVRDVDFNPFNQHMLVTCGDDHTARVCDVRNTSQPLAIINSHQHWVWTVRFNPFHDQLLMTSSSDWRVHVTSLASLSCEVNSVSLLHDEARSHGDVQDAADNNASKDGLCVSYDEHEDSVYGAEWAACDASTLASVSYDGRVLVRRLPARLRASLLL